MIHELAVLNKPVSEGGFPVALNQAPWVVWSTCVRQVRIGFREWLKEDVGSPYLGKDAYRFILEVICGLHSPMVGETEVLGQFRELALSAENEPRLAKLFQLLITDAKNIRQKHLINLGANSYGSLTRKYAKEFDHIAILGAGKLTLDILPWLKEKKVVEVFVRSPQKAQALTSFKNVKIKNLEDLSEASALLVAAPVEAKWAHTWVRQVFPKTSLVMDLRGDSAHEPIAIPQATSLLLKDFFAELNTNQDVIRQKIELAKREIQKVTEDRLKSQEIRPFGWDDICA